MIILCDKMGKEVFNLVPAIVAQTVYSLNYGWRVKRTHLKCYTKMLHVWFLSHLNQQLLYKWGMLDSVAQARKIVKPFQSSNQPLREVNWI